jgi:hypothetical protein
MLIFFYPEVCPSLAICDIHIQPASDHGAGSDGTAITFLLGPKDWKFRKISSGAC